GKKFFFGKKRSVAPMEKFDKLTVIIGITCSLLYALFFQIGDGLFKYTFNHSDVRVFEALLIRYIINLVIVSSNMLIEKISPIQSFTKTCYLVAAGILRLSCVIFLGMALKRLDMGTNAVIFGTLPAFCILFGWLLLKEKTKLSDMMYGLLSYVGVVLVVWEQIETPKNDYYSYILGIVFSLCSVLSICFYCVVIKRITETTRLQVTLFYIHFTGLLILPFAPWIFGTSFVLIRSPLIFTYLLLGAGVSYFLCVICEVVSLRCLNIALIMLLRNSEFVWAYSYDMIITHIFPNWIVIIGLLIVIVATSMIAVNMIYDIPYLATIKRWESKICKTV
uniref:EamA domain-containing protein n=1 Tax=Clytia hemisphaerica TaxID=252671 RepID=A0A7M5XJA0_9CNID